MLNILAEAMLIATRLGRVDRPTQHTRKNPQALQDIAEPRTAQRQRSRGR